MSGSIRSNHQVVIDLVDLFERRLPVDGMIHRVSIAVQAALKKICNPFFVFNEKNACGY